MFRFEELEIWKLGIDYASRCYDISKTFPKEETFSLGDQLRRAAVSVSTNIAEGSAGTVREFRNFVSIAVKSAHETVSLLVFASARGYISLSERDRMYEDAEKLIRKMQAFRNSLVVEDSPIRQAISNRRLAIRDLPSANPGE